MWDIATRKPIGQPIKEPDQQWILSLAFSPDGKTIASGSEDGGIILWDITNHQQISPKLSGHLEHIEWTSVQINSLSFNSSGNILVSGSSDHTITLWDVNTLQPIGKQIFDIGPVMSVTFSPDDGIIASGSCAEEIRSSFCIKGGTTFWDVETHTQIGQPLIGHVSNVNSVSFSPDGKVLASGGCSEQDNSFSCHKGQIILWDVTTHLPIGQPIIGHTNFVSSLSFHPDGKTIASGSFDKSIILWDVDNHLATGKPLTEKRTGEISSVAFSPDGKTLIAGSSDNEILLLDTFVHQPLSIPLEGHKGSVYSTALSPQGDILASGSYDKAIILWNAETYQPIVKLEGHEDGVSHLAFSPDGKMLASTSFDHKIILWNTETYKAFDLPITGKTLAFSIDGKIIALESDDKTIKLWDVNTRNTIEEIITGHDRGVSDIVFSPNGKVIAFAGSYDYIITLLNSETGKSICELKSLNNNDVIDIAFSPDSILLASANGGGTTDIWNVQTCKLVDQFITGISRVMGATTGYSMTNVLFDHKGSLLVSGSANGTIVLWDVEKHQPIGQPLFGYSTSEMAFSLDNKILYTGGWNYGKNGWYHSVLVSNLDPVFWMKITCQRVGRNFTQAEWQQYFPDEEYRITCPQWPAGE